MQCRSCAAQDERLDRRRREREKCSKQREQPMRRPCYKNHIISWFSVFGLHFGPNIWKHSRFDHVKWLVNAHVWRASRRPFKGSPTGWRTVGTAWMTVSKARLNVVSFNGLWVLLLWALLITASVLCRRHQLPQRKPETDYSRQSLTGTCGRIDRNAWIHCDYHNFNSVGKWVTIPIEQIINLSWMACHQCQGNCHIL